MNVDGVITSIANQLVEVLKVPTQMAWEAGLGYTKIKGIIGLSQIVLEYVLVLFLTLLLYKSIKYIYNFSFWEKYLYDDEGGKSVAVFLSSAFLLFVYFMFSSIIISSSQYIIINIFRILYPESMLIYQIIEKVLK